MEQYLVNLTDNLINKNRYYEISKKIKGKKFLKHIKIDLEAGDVKKMNPGTLGRIMFGFRAHEVVVGKEEIFDATHFYGDCGNFLRELVSFFLACAIRDRIITIDSGVPCWIKKSEKSLKLR